MTRLPDFLIIGAMKAATSSLHAQLGAQDGIFTTSPKEIYFFSDDPVYERGLDWYGEHFAAAEPGDLCGESSTHYAKHPTYPNTIPRIQQHVPDVRLIYMMRHPIDRLVSAYSHMWLANEVKVPFDEALAGAVPELIGYSSYTKQLKPFFEAFGASRVQPVFFDRMHAEPDETLRAVATHIGFHGPVAWDDNLGAHNVSSERLKHTGARSLMKRVPGYDRLRNLVPESAKDKARDRFWRLPDTPDVSESQREALSEVFDADLRLLGEWLDIDLDTASFKTATAERQLGWTDALLDAYPDPLHSGPMAES